MDTLRKRAAVPIIWRAAAVVWLSIPARWISAQVPARQQDTLGIARARPERVLIRATIASVDTTRFVLRGPTAAQTRELRLSPQLLRQLAPLRGQSFTALVEERSAPSGIRIGVVLRKGESVQAIAESVRDMQLLRPVDRGGIEVALRPAEGRKFVYENVCQTVYNVPTAFTIAGEQVIVQPYETRVMRTKAGSYTITLGASQFIVPKPCSTVFEGSRSVIEYTILRNAS